MRVLGLLFLVLLCGCSRFVPVQGTVTLDGEPLADASVTFIPPGNSPISFSLTGADGDFKIVTNKSGDGTLPGTYKVTVSKVEIGAMPPAPEMKPGDATIIHSTLPPRKPLVPTKYMSATTTPLQVTIPANGDRQVLLELKSDEKDP